MRVCVRACATVTVLVAHSLLPLARSLPPVLRGCSPALVLVSTVRKAYAERPAGQRMDAPRGDDAVGGSGHVWGLLGGGCGARGY